jgi:enoyl-CoA hydratase/carnithine racemase
MSDLVLCAVTPGPDGGNIAHVTLNDPRRLNCMSNALMDAFIETMDKLSEDADLRVVILTGAGEKAFVGGANVHELAQFDEHIARRFLTKVHRSCQAVREFPVPVIARVNGWCLGAGLELAASCDLRVAADHAHFGMPEVLLGLPSVVEAALLPQLIGWGKARQLVYTAENIDAATALAWGLVEKIVPMAGLDAAADHWANAIAKAGPKAMRLQKELVRHWESMAPSDAIQEGIRNMARAAAGEEPRRLVAETVARMKSKTPH